MRIGGVTSPSKKLYPEVICKEMEIWDLLQWWTFKLDKFHSSSHRVFQHFDPLVMSGLEKYIQIHTLGVFPQVFGGKQLFGLKIWCLITKFGHIGQSFKATKLCWIASDPSMVKGQNDLHNVDLTPLHHQFQAKLGVFIVQILSCWYLCKCLVICNFKDHTISLHCSHSSSPNKLW